jgi:hypothetical protein
VAVAHFRLVRRHVAMTLKVKRLLYRVIVLLLATLAALYGVSGQIAYAMNAFYFPHQTPRSDLLWALIPYCVAIILLIEGIFLPIFRKLTRAA